MATTETADVKKLQSAKELDFDGPVYEGMDFEDDAWSYSPPPPHDIYDFKWFLSKDGIVVKRDKKDDPKSSYVQIAIEGKLINNSEFEDSMAYAYLDSRIFRGKNISTLVAFILKAGYRVEQPVTMKKLVQMVEAILKKEPIIKAEYDWKASYKYVNKKGEEEYKNLYNHYKDFPDDGKGGKKYEFTVQGVDGEVKDIRAQGKINRFFGKNETLPTINRVSEVVSSAVSAGEPTLELDEPSPKVVKASEVEKPKTQKKEEDDLDLVLA